MELPAGNAADERLLLFRIRFGQVVGEGSTGREGGAAPRVASGPGPRLVAGDSQNSAVGDCEAPRVPKNRSFTSNGPFPNWVELKLTCTLSGYRKIVSK